MALFASLYRPPPSWPTMTMAAQSVWGNYSLLLATTNASAASSPFTLTLLGSTRIALRATVAAFSPGTVVSVGGVACSSTRVSDDGTWLVTVTPPQERLCSSSGDCGYQARRQQTGRAAAGASDCPPAPPYACRPSRSPTQTRPPWLEGRHPCPSLLALAVPLPPPPWGSTGEPRWPAPPSAPALSHRQSCPSPPLLPGEKEQARRSRSSFRSRSRPLAAASACKRLV